MKLLHLLKKDVLLMWRSKTWTIFEILLPLVLIACFGALFGSIALGADGKDPEDLKISSFKDKGIDCENVKMQIYGEKDIAGKFDPLPVSDRDKIIKDLKDFKCSDKIHQSQPAFIINNNRSSTFIVPSTGKYEYVMRYQYFINKIVYGQEQTSRPKPIPDFNQEMTVVEFRAFGSQMLLLLIMIYPICLAMPVMSTVRTVLAEKDTVKPYLSTIGLPVWLFYVEHYIFAVLKTSILITLSSIIWVIMMKGVPSFLLVGVFAYTLSCAAFALLLSTLISSSKRAMEITTLVWFGSWVLGINFAESCYEFDFLLSLNLNHALIRFIQALGNAAGIDGLSFGDIFSSKDPRMQCVAVYLGYLFANAVWMIVLSLFMEQIVSFIQNFLLKQLWKRLGKLGSGSNVAASSKKANSKLDVGVSTILDCEEKLEHRAQAPADIELTGLVKIYPNGERAVNGLSLRALRGQVSILLGHNGCGKSTTFGMVTGVHKATEGTVMIGEINANENRSEARKLVGYCPQYNPLYDKLTVWEHLRLANALKGGDSSNFEVEATSLLESIGLMPKKDEQSRNLSGGMKRKLCVCMAMIGGSRVILLDEPTAGMDPAARIDMQKMLLKEKEKRTILLTTHYMDEAETLGDWVFVMSHGKMAASGSIHFLKKKYGEGLMVTLVFKNTADLKKCYQTGYEVVKSFAPSAKIRDERGQMVEISMSESEKTKLPALLQCLEAIMDKSAAGMESVPANLRDQVATLNVVTIGVSMSSLEQVFIRIGDECDAIIEKTDVETKKAYQRKQFVALLEVKARPPQSGISFFFQKLVALLEKRFYYLYRNIMQILLQIILPLALLWWFAKSYHNLSSDTGIADKVVYESLAIGSLKVSTAVVQMEDSSDERLVKYLKGFNNLMVYTEDYSKSLTDITDKHSAGFQPLAFIAKIPKNNRAIFYVAKDYRVQAVVMNVMASAWYLAETNLDALPERDSNAVWVITDSKQGAAQFLSLLAPVLMFCLLWASIVIQSVTFLVEERLCKFSHQQLLTGLSPHTYWFAIVLWDFALYFIIALYTMIFVWAFAAFGSYWGGVFVLLILLFVYLAPLVYLVSMLVNSPSKANFLLYLHAMVAIFSLQVGLMLIHNNDKRNTFIMVFRCINPVTAFAMGVGKVASFAHSDFIRQYIFEVNELWEMNALGIEVVFMLAFSIIVTVFLCTWSTKAVRRGCFSVFHRTSQRRNRKVYRGFEACTAVNEEEKLIQNVNRQEKTVVIDGLIKDFGKFRAVNGLSVTVGHQECFGMLGANGAGKTTTFDIITGLQYPTGGTVTIDGKNITRNIHIGYCPQFDAMLQQISGRQVLRIMARLQGYTNVNELVEIVLECVGMKEHGNKLVKNCSGGQKRKISVGIALLSRATCIILDEPTAGIDPRARREIWDILHAMREQGKCSIILTSHSMEECEALCTRIGVLRTGEMIALGTSQSLKSQYGNTYMMTLIVHKLADREAVSKMVSSEMPSAVLKTPESNLTTSLVWELPRQKDDKWSQKYAQVEALAKKANVKDYMLTQASLEDTFIRLNTSD